MSAPVDRPTFVKQLKESGLLDAETMRTALNDAPDSERGRVLARYLVQKGILTRFQAEQVLAGRTTGFILGQYRILEMIGHGGMGRVFKAEHSTMRRIVALKVLRSELTKTDRARKLFTREVQAAAKLNHPNIATAHDANEVNGRCFLVLEYIAGPSLSALVREHGALPVGQACEFIRQAAWGLQHAHELGMVHRDLKPSNLLIQPNMGHTSAAGGTVKIVDFGLARLQARGDDDLPAEGQTVLGTPDFLSPEQGRDLRSADIRSDLYSLGCTLYYLLAGRVPFPGGTALEKLERHASEEPEAIERIRPIVSKEVAAIVKKLMAKDPAQRFSTPRDLAVALEPFSEPGPVVWAGRRDDSPSHWGSSGAGLQQMRPLRNSTSALSGTQSMTDMPTFLTDDDMSFIGQKKGPDRRTMWFFLAMLLGFMMGAVLIALATIGKQ